MTEDVLIEEAWAEYQRRGVGEGDFAGWAELFAEDGVYLEHGQDLRLEGRETIKKWIIAEMGNYPALGLWIEWAIVDGDRIAFYIWNNLPDPIGSGRRFAFPNTTILDYAGDGEWTLEVDHYNPDNARIAFTDWMTAGGTMAMPPDPTLTGVAGWAPEPGPAAPGAEVEEAIAAYSAALTAAAAGGGWSDWANLFTEDAEYHDHVFGRRSGRAAIHELAASDLPRGGAGVEVRHHLTDGSRVVLLVEALGETSWDMFVLLHYAGAGRWSYEEVLWNPHQATNRR